MHVRQKALREWLLHTLKQKAFNLIPLAGDASFRKYFRIQSQGLTQIVMDAPPGKEDLRPFIHRAEILAQAEVLVPQILAVNLDQGFLLLSDLGDQLLLSALQKSEKASIYYDQAIKILFKIQSCSVNKSSLACFDKAFMLKEMELATKWFFKAYLALDLQQEEINLIEETRQWIATEVAQQPLTFIHRDYHSRNLMLVGEQAQPVLAVIDFQDAMIGPVTYDLVSLLKDCYISWPRAKILQWLKFFYKQNTLAQNYSFAEFVRAFDLCGLQRHLKILGIFCRLHLRDNKSGYLNHLPLALKYVLECSQLYVELDAFFQFLNRRVHLPCILP